MQQSPFIMRINLVHKNTVGKMRSALMLQQVVHRINTRVHKKFVANDLRYGTEEVFETIFIY